MMTAAEFRARLVFLGFTIDSFTTMLGWDRRTLQRQAGGATSVTQRTVDKVRELEQLANTQLAQWDAATENGTPIQIPRLNETVMPGALPPHWYLALAGRHLNKWGEDADVEWALEWESKDVKEI